MENYYPETKEQIRSEFESTRATFHELLDSLSDEDLRKESRNAGWTNGEILAHMTFGFIIVNALLPMVRVWGHLPRWMSKPFAWLLNSLTVPFNRVNALGARLQARAFTRQRIGTVFDYAQDILLKKVRTIKPDEWERGMYYPTRWDANFGEFMTIEKLFRYPVIHFNFHLEQISSRHGSTQKLL